MRLPRPLFIAAIVTFLAALWGGLARIQWLSIPAATTLAGDHGLLMVAGFLGSLISLERAVALNKRYFLLAPAAGLSGSLLVIAGLRTAGALLILVNGLGYAAILLAMVRQHRAGHTVTMLLGGLMLVAGNSLLLARQPLSGIVVLWVSYLVLTIAGERLELNRVLRQGRGATRLFWWAVATLIAGALLSQIATQGRILFNAGLAFVALWLLYFDIARRTVRRRAITRYIAINLLLGYMWLAIAGVIGLLNPAMVAGLTYDAWLHTIFLGFVFSMIVAHMPIILPALTGLRIDFSAMLYIPVFLLQTSLMMRVISDLLNLGAGRRWGGLLNGIALLSLIAVIASAALKARRESNE